MRLAARAARRQRQKELSDGVRTRKLGRIKYEEPSVALKLSGEQVGSLRHLTVNPHCLNTVTLTFGLFLLMTVFILRSVAQIFT